MADRKIQLQPKESSEPLKSSDSSSFDKPGKDTPVNSLNAMGKGASSVSDIPLTPDNIMSLQRTVGNRAVTRLVQAKLKVSQPGDAYEREADRVADHVMRMPDEGGAVQRQALPEEEKRKKPEEEGAVQKKQAPGAVQRQAMPAEEERKKRAET